MSLMYILHSGKNSKLIYYIKCIINLATPKSLLRRKLHRALENGKKRKDWDYIQQRVNYYNKLTEKTSLPDDAPTLKNHTYKNRKGASVYFFDTYEYTRWFPMSYRWLCIHGDVITVPLKPSIVKSRPIKGENANSILLNLNKVRHFIFLKDKLSFSEKKNQLIFRGACHGKPNRETFLDLFWGDPLCDVADVATDSTNPIEKRGKLISLYDHLQYKFILALEGNDVSSNLKWVMSSHSIAVMPRPTYETWFMEGTLIPNYHYIEIKKDYSDLKERLNHYIQNPDEAEAIIRHANEYTRQFQDTKRERIISLLVLNKYFNLTQNTNDQYTAKKNK